MFGIKKQNPKKQETAAEDVVSSLAAEAFSTDAKDTAEKVEDNINPVVNTAKLPPIAVKTPKKEVETYIDEESAKILAEVAEVESEGNRFNQISEGKVKKEIEIIDKPVLTLFDTIEKNCPVRLAASKDEKLAAKLIRDSFTKELGKPSRMEPFDVRPLAGRQGLPIYAAIYLFSLLLYIFFAPASIAVSLLLSAMLVVQVYLNKDVFDILFKKKTSYNIVTSVESNVKEIRKTVVLGANYDSDYGRLSISDFLTDGRMSKKMSDALKIGAFCSVVVLFVFSVIKTVLMYTSNVYRTGMSFGRSVMFFVPLIISALGIMYMALQYVYVKKYAKEGRTNIAGAGVSIAVAKYFTKHGSEIPKDCKLVVATFGSNKAGIKGSASFLKQHLNRDEVLINPVFIELDNMLVGDYKIVTRDNQLRVQYDKNLAETAKKVLNNNGIDADFIEAENSMDSTNFTVNGIPSICVTRLSKTSDKREEEFVSAEVQCKAIIELVKELAKEPKDEKAIAEKPAEAAEKPKEIPAAVGKPAEIKATDEPIADKSKKKK